MSLLSSKHVLAAYQSLMIWAENVPLVVGMRATDRKILRHLIRRDDPTILDVGANIGSATIFFKTLFRKADIRSFEPHAETFATLKRRTSHIEGITLHNVAVGEVSEKRNLYVNSVSSTNSFLKLNDSSRWKNEQFMIRPLHGEEVQVVTIDEFCESQHLTQIDLLKLDVQGFEPAALRGAAGMLGSQAIKVIKIEVMPGDFYEQSTSFLQIESALTEAGYRLWSIAHLHYGKAGDVRYLDAYYIPSGRPAS